MLFINSCFLAASIEPLVPPPVAYPAGIWSFGAVGALDEPPPPPEPHPLAHIAAITTNDNPNRTIDSSIALRLSNSIEKR